MFSQMLRGRGYQKLSFKKQLIVFGSLSILLISVFKFQVFAQLGDLFEPMSASVSAPNGMVEIPLKVRKDLHRLGNIRKTRSGRTHIAKIPDSIVYQQLFRHLKELNKKSEFENSMGRDGSKFKNLYKKKAKLLANESVLLRRTAIKVNRELEIIDRTALAEIKRFRQSVRNRKLFAADELPEIPKKLSELQERRKRLVEMAVSDLRSGFGEARFEEFSRFVDEKIRPGIRKID